MADDLGIHEGLLYNWRRKYTADGDKTKYATLEEENRALQRENA
ncbi:MAG: transposase, partial [Candidatus Delongbacteria bacterium]|nr:transposase [Candidatus Delongbacteria bacterium]